MACNLIIARDLECTISKHNTSIMHPPVGNHSFQNSKPQCLCLGSCQKTNKRAISSSWRAAVKPTLRSFSVALQEQSPGQLLISLTVQVGLCVLFMRLSLLLGYSSFILLDLNLTLYALISLHDIPQSSISKYSLICREYQAPPSPFLTGPLMAPSRMTCSSSKNLLWTELSYWRRQWHPTPVLLPGKSHGWRSLIGCSPWGCTELDTTEATQQQQQQNSHSYFFHFCFSLEHQF